MGPRKLFRLERKRGEESLSLSPKIFPDRSGKLFLFPNPENYENRNWREIQEFREGGDGKEARDFIVRETERVNRNRSKPASTKESQILKSVWTSRHSRNNGVFTSSRKYTRGFLLSPTIDRSLPLPPPSSSTLRFHAFVTRGETELEEEGIWRANYAHKRIRQVGR